MPAYLTKKEDTHPFWHQIPSICSANQTQFYHFFRKKGILSYKFVVQSYNIAANNLCIYFVQVLH